MLATYARRVQTRFDSALDGNLLSALEACQPGRDQNSQELVVEVSPHTYVVGVELGNPDSVVLQSEVVATLAARLRRAPWVAVATESGAGNASVLGARSALRLLGAMFKLLHSPSAAVSMLRATVFEKLLREV